MNERNMEDLRKEFENFNINEEACVDGSCASDEETDLKDYPSYTEALYAKLVSPAVSGIYVSRWDIKDIALEAGDSMAIHPRKRMFELLMKYATSKENMEAVLDALGKHMEGKIVIYQELMQDFPASSEIFQPKIDKARKTMKLFPQIIEEYFV
ncbi:hypothetical protein YH65_08580 [Sulfurovum lithotrophicum]|uniref:Uncharacterized protein n=1 Tax=Sulfurovum lithotrophicum TaxID=206403 RepID=A0A7U4RR60_9BACT|nr:hypothetical protein [Sulfurovum lithotrophicum]AKF25431.1 hypothetical protein YH65_08580 [Sulfurovum lithotrophicum]